MDISFGPQGDKLRGKNLTIATTTGGSADATQASGCTQFMLSELLRPLLANANFMCMRSEPVFAVTGVRTPEDAALDPSTTACYAAAL